MIKHTVQIIKELILFKEQKDSAKWKREPKEIQAEENPLVEE